MLEYYINKDERSEFNADVRRDDETIFEIEGFEIFEDGWMKHGKDLDGLFDYLKHLGLVVAGENRITFG